jgi:phosphatidylglycerol:prolipoprotein diacylglycerol transferase
MVPVLMVLMPATAVGRVRIHDLTQTTLPGQEDNEMRYDATITRFFNIPPYTFFAVIGVIFSSSLFILLLLKYNYSIQRYTKIFFLSGIGMLTGAKLFGFLTGLYGALGNNEPVTLKTFLNTGIVFYGGLIGFLSSFLLICKIWNKEIEYGVVDLAVICIPLFHFWGRLGCFFGGCCFGIESHSFVSILYTTRINEGIDTALRLPIQLIEAAGNIIIFIVLVASLNIKKLKGRLIKIYLFSYAIMRIIIEFYRGDLVRGVWHGVSFSQIISIIFLLIFFTGLLIKKEKAHV